MQFACKFCDVDFAFKQGVDTSPSVYVPKLVDSLEMNADGVFESNLLPKPSDFDYERASFEDFCMAQRRDY